LIISPDNVKKETRREEGSKTGRIGGKKKTIRKKRKIWYIKEGGKRREMEGIERDGKNKEKKEEE
jgi:hypothetical protein